MDNFSIHQRFDGPVWLHNCKPVWVSHFPAVEGFSVERYHAYKAVTKVPVGRMPWTVDNVRVTTTGALEEALQAADQAFN